MNFLPIPSRPCVSFCYLAALFAFAAVVATSSLDLNNVLIAATPLVIAAVAQTLPLATGGHGLSAGAIVLLGATIVTALPTRGAEELFKACGLAVSIGAVLGAATGFLVGKFRAKSSVVTLSMGAAAVALSLDIVNGASAPAGSALYDVLFGLEISGIALIPLAGIAVMCGIASYAMKILELDRHSWLEPTNAQIVGSYIVAGMGSAAAGIFLGGSLGSMNASLGVPVLLQVLAAVALGGSLSNCGTGAILGSLLGATVVVVTEYMAVLWGVPEFLSTSLDAFWLFVAAATGGGLKRLATGSHQAVQPIRSFRTGDIAEAIVLLAVVFLGWKLVQVDIVTTIIGLALLAAGQAAVARLGYIDLSMPAVVSLASVAVISLTGGRNLWLLGIVPALLVTAAGVGILHGVLASNLKRAVVPVTVATAGVVQSVSTALLFYFPGSYAPSFLTLLTEHRSGGFAIFPFIAVAVLFIPVVFWPETSSGNRRLASVMAFVYSALCSATYGILLAGLNGTAHFVLVDVNTFPALAAAFLAVNLKSSLLTFVGAAALSATAIVFMDTYLIAAGLGHFPRVLVLAAVVVVVEVLSAGPQRN